MVYAIAAPENLRRVEQAIREELGRVVRKGFSQEEFDELKAAELPARQNLAMDDELLASTWARLLESGKDWSEKTREDQAFAALTLDDVNRAARKLVRLEETSVVLAGDIEKAKAAGTPFD